MLLMILRCPSSRRKSAICAAASSPCNCTPESPTRLAISATSRRRFIYEDANGFHFASQRGDDLGGCRDLYPPRAGSEDEAQRVGSGGNAELRIAQTGGAADLHPDGPLPGHQRATADWVSNSRNASPGRGARISDSPIRKASNPACRSRAMSSRVSIPLSATFTTPAGMRDGQLQRSVEIDLEGVQVAVVDADQIEARIERAPHLFAVVDFAEHVELELTGARAQVSIRHRRERGDDQQNRVRAIGARFQYLELVDDEIFAQAGKLGRREAISRFCSEPWK